MHGEPGQQPLACSRTAVEKSKTPNCIFVTKSRIPEPVWEDSTGEVFASVDQPKSGLEWSGGSSLPSERKEGLGSSTSGVMRRRLSAATSVALLTCRRPPARHRCGPLGSHGVSLLAYLYTFTYGRSQCYVPPICVQVWPNIGQI